MTDPKPLLEARFGHLPFTPPELVSDGLAAVLVHPTFMIGPLDYKITSNALLLALYRGQLLGVEVVEAVAGLAAYRERERLHQAMRHRLHRKQQA